jgi:hypothetical protein
MFKSAYKKRAPVKQLRAAAEQVSKMLITKQVSHSVNMLQLIAEDSKSPILPGLPSYLPHKWTLDAVHMAMFWLLTDWAKLTKTNKKRQENIAEFFSFVSKKVLEQERKYKLESVAMEHSLDSIRGSPLLKDIFSPVRKRETAQGIHKFFIDSFAVFIIAKGKTGTPEYANWFLGEWIPSLYVLWTNKEKSHE